MTAYIDPYEFEKAMAERQAELLKRYRTAALFVDICHALQDAMTDMEELRDILFPPEVKSKPRQKPKRRKT
jgi:hypothetical protein